MSEQVTEQQEQRSPLQTEHGSTKVEDNVVSKIAGIAAQEVEGVRMGGGTSRAFGGIMDSVTGAQSQSRGVSVEVGEVEAAVDLTMSVIYGKSIPQISEAVRRNVINRIQNLVGLQVKEVNITITDIFFPQEEQQQAAQQSELENPQEGATRVR